VRRSSRGKTRGTAVALWLPPVGRQLPCYRTSNWWLLFWKRRHPVLTPTWPWDLSTLPTTWVCGRGGRNLSRRRGKSQPSSWTRYVPLSCSNLCPHAATVLTMQRFDFQEKRQRWFRILKFVYSTGKIIVNLVFSWRRTDRRSRSSNGRTSGRRMRPTRRSRQSTRRLSRGLPCHLPRHVARVVGEVRLSRSRLPASLDASEVLGTSRWHLFLIPAVPSRLVLK
jgi:hypothetical protein